MNKQPNNQNWMVLAEAIREEVRECAWLSSLLDRQQKAILARDYDMLNEVNGSIKEQHSQVMQVREKRIAVLSELTGSDEPRTLGELAGDMPEVAKPLFEALAREGVSIRKRIRRRTEQNHRILERATLKVGEMLEYMRPGSVTRTYSRHGGYHTSSGLKGRMVHTAV
jgi:flagellar biosynthesis/type III secretory pathway chaperone